MDVCVYVYPCVPTFASYGHAISLTYSFESGSYTESGARLAASCLSLTALGLHGGTAMSFFALGAEDPDLHPHACTANALPTAPENYCSRPFHRRLP